MDNTYKVSVIVPIYNKEKYLKKFLDIALYQSLDNYELIFVDDGSTDSSPEMLRSVANSHSNVKLITQTNQYAGVARNNGMKVAEGEYLIFWDPDDIPDCFQLEKMYNRAKKDDADICLCAMSRIDQNSGIIEKGKSYLLITELPEHLPFSKDDIPSGIFNITTSHSMNKMFRRSFIENTGLQYDTCRVGEDVWFVMRSLFLAERITYIKKSLYTYRVNTNESLTDTLTVDFHSLCIAYQKAYDWVTKKTNNEDIIQSLRNKALKSIIQVFNRISNYHDYCEYVLRLKNQYFPSMGLEKKTAEYYRNVPLGSYLRFCKILDSNSIEDILFYDFSLVRDKSERQKRKIQQLKKEIQVNIVTKE